MAQRTYRVVTRGRDEGTLSYDERLDAFQHRVVVRVDEAPDEEDVARTAGEPAAVQHLGDAAWGIATSASPPSCMDDIKVRRR